MTSDFFSGRVSGGRNGGGRKREGVPARCQEENGGDREWPVPTVIGEETISTTT